MREVRSDRVMRTRIFAVRDQTQLCPNILLREAVRQTARSLTEVLMPKTFF